MAPLVLQSSSPTIPSSSIQTSFFPKTSQLSLNKKTKKPYYSVPNNVVSCRATNNGNQNPTPSSNSKGDSALNRFDRRDLLIGLGGLYGATNLANDPFALAAPIAAPDLTLCGNAVISETTGETTYCCPPTTTTITDYKPPSFSKLRYRPPAHLVDADYLAKFTKAMNLMKELPSDDPRSFMQQAYVHCAYCNGAYDQVGFPDQDLQVHFSWLFFPFHRWYLYFYERILGKLIGDPDFVMPFWNWDAPAGMPIPAIYVNPQSPLYDDKRNVNHQPPKLADLDYNGTDKDITDAEQIAINLKLMYKQMVSNATTATLFHGKPYRAGDAGSPGGGSVELGCHTAIHRWVGDPRQTYNEDMGNFYSAGRDPVFYAHHGNVDRMWSIWKTLPGTKRNDFSDTDWLDASFVFYDENANLVRVKVRDCVDSKNLGYDYQPVDIPWLKTKPTARKFAKKGGKARGSAMAAEIKSKNVVRNAFPIVLDKTVSIEIPRPRKSRSKREKEEDEEVLVLEGIQLATQAAVKFDIYINDEDDEAPSGPEDAEFAGSFTNIPHSHTHAKKLNTTFSLAISDVLEDLDVEGDDNIVVTLVPREGKGLVSVGNIKVDYIRE
ncbi:PREDICTED: polyphenol oxidase I, chloroplastic [Theobroma cacao]|uniref:Polyphenol oxidase I, chloroplastic n=1 Tax=Theobroma cacao TaxID=3641 RepID=A0AB32WH89_THECC|nr:PREDICTED: polyphenol oxidase I, chloroplastic [Theobroma cacao]